MEKLDLTGCHGWYFKCKISETYCTGRISVEDDRVYLCQNYKDGDTAYERFGYKYSWVLKRDTSESSEISSFKYGRTAESVPKSFSDKLRENDGKPCTITFSCGSVTSGQVCIDTDSEVFILHNDTYISDEYEHEERGPVKDRGDFKYACSLGYNPLESDLLDEFHVKSITFNNPSITRASSTSDYTVRKANDPIDLCLPKKEKTPLNVRFISQSVISI